MRVNLRLSASSLIVLTLSSLPGFAQEKAGRLSSSDQTMLLSLLEDLIFDPGPGAERVRIPWQVRDDCGTRSERPDGTPDWWVEREQRELCDGWLVKDKDGGRVYLTEGFSIPAPHPGNITRVDFVACCREACAAARGPTAKVVQGKVTRQPPHWLAKELGEESELVIAAWLLRLGQANLAARILALLPNGKEEEKVKVYSAVEFATRHGLIEAFHGGREAEALGLGRKLQRLESACVHGTALEAQILGDLRQRQKQGTIRIAGPGHLPGDFSKWDKERQLAFLIDALDLFNEDDDIDLTLNGRWDWRAAALLKIGKPAIPALVRTFTTDERLTRSISGPHSIVTVRWVAGKLVKELTGASARDNRFSGASAERFNFDIDPNTPLKDLLPAPPQLTESAVHPLTEDLKQVPEVLLQEPLPKGISGEKAKERTALTIARINHLNEKKPDHFMEALLETRPDLAGLPVLLGDTCRSTGERSREFARAVKIVRESLVPPPGFGSGFFNVMSLSTESVDEWYHFFSRYTWACVAQDKWGSIFGGYDYDQTVESARIAALMQIFGPESANLRLGLVDYLWDMSHPDATRALARMALFSAEEDVRSAAVRALKDRRESDYEDILLDGFRYPLPAVAQRASEAVIKLKRKDLLAKLVDLLDEGDPRAPVLKKIEGKWVPVVSELVTINHNKNCLLCHAPAKTASVALQTLTAPVPVRDGSSSYYSESSPDLLVRVDVTYLRQDFSMLLPVASGDDKSEMQRFDFLVRSRMLTNQEAKLFFDRLPSGAPGDQSPYRRAVLHALRGLSGMDTEPTALAWRRLLKLRS
jgi:hypothetical protein